LGGFTPEQIVAGRMLLWKGYCPVHQIFEPRHNVKFFNQHPEGLENSHSECRFEVCRLSGHAGFTEYIVKTIREAVSNRRWPVETDLNLVNCVAEEFKPQGKIVGFMSVLVCLCSTMNRIGSQHLARCLENLVDGNFVSAVQALVRGRQLAKQARQRVFKVS
jgi:quinolinate synthase